MYKKYNLNELAQTIQALKEKNTREGFGEEIGLFTLMGEIGFDLKEVRDFAEYCNLRLYDSKKYNEDFEYKSCIEKAQFKKYIQKKIEKLSGILERLEGRKPRKDIGGTRGKGEEIKRIYKINPALVDIISPRSNEEFGIALGKIINHLDIPVEMIGYLINCDKSKIQDYLTGRYKDPSKEFIEEIADFFNVDPRHFQKYRKYLGKDYKEDRPITLANYRITKKKREAFELPEESNEGFKEALGKLIKASGIKPKELAIMIHCAQNILYKCFGEKRGRLFKKVFVEKVSRFFNISPGYFREYRENEMKDKILADIIKYKTETMRVTEGQKRRTQSKREKDRKDKLRKYSKEYYKNNLEKIKEINRKRYEKNPGYSRDYYKSNPEKIKEYKKRFKENNPGYPKEYYKRNQSIIRERARERKRANRRTDKINRYFIKLKGVEHIGNSAIT